MQFTAILNYQLRRGVMVKGLNVNIVSERQFDDVSDSLLLTTSI